MICIAIVSLAMSGCATVALMPDKLDATAKRFSPSPGKANIYVARMGSLLGMDRLFTVYLDGRLVGSIAPNTYLLLEVAPGEHRLLLIAPRATQGSLTLDAQAARNMVSGQDALKPFSIRKKRDEALRGKIRWVTYQIKDIRRGEKSTTLNINQIIRLDLPGQDSFWGQEKIVNKMQVTMVLPHSHWKVRSYRDKFYYPGMKD